MIEFTAVGRGLQQTLRCDGHTLFCLKILRQAPQAIADLVHYYLQILTQTNEGPPTVHNAARIFEKFCYENKDALSAGIIVAGWDEEEGASVYNIPLGGGLFRQPWAIGGMSTSSCAEEYPNSFQALDLPMYMAIAMPHIRRDGTRIRPSNS